MAYKGLLSGAASGGTARETMTVGHRRRRSGIRDGKESIAVGSDGRNERLGRSPVEPEGANEPDSAGGTRDSG
ncbi:MAG TPA: hypothetical protein DCQ98_20845 [Planctomycetaceae bacterium]|nr:hypothetical protein [Planctomycetaceae bacterium]